MKRMDRKIPREPFQLLVFSSRPYQGWVILSLLLVLVASAIGSSIPYVYKRIIDSISVTQVGNTNEIWFWAVFYVTLYFLTSLTWRSSGYAASYWATGARKTSREFLTSYVTGHSHNYFSNRFAGAIGTKIGQASNGTFDLIGAILWQWTSFAIELIVSLYLVFNTNVYIAWVFVAWIVVVTPINIFLYKKKLPLGKATSKAETDIGAGTIDMLTNINAVQDYARRDFEISRINSLIENRRRTGLKNWQFAERTIAINNFFEAIFAGGMILGTIYLYTMKAVSAGDVVLIISLVSMIRRSISGIGQQFNAFADNLSTIRESLTEVLNDQEIVDRKGAQELHVTNGEIVFKNISFKYGEREIFKDLNFNIKAGERIGLIGKSGAGKSTLMKLLNRQYDLSRGEILIDDQNIAEVTQNSLRGSIATVPQEPLLFHRSIKENIAYGDLSADDKSITEAAEQAQAHGFIKNIADGYDSLVGERGVKLSGGEKQRVAIARAFLKKSKILLLDEATSALDSESEILIQQALEKLMEGKTVIAIAHRLSTLRAMDRLIVMDGGKIVEDGTHEELLKRGGIYAELWSHQAGGFIKED